MKSLSRMRLFVTPWTVAYQLSQSMGFSRQEYWSGLPFPSSGALPVPGIEPGSHIGGRCFYRLSQVTWQMLEEGSKPGIPESRFLLWIWGRDGKPGLPQGWWQGLLLGQCLSLLSHCFRFKTFQDLFSNTPLLSQLPQPASRSEWHHSTMSFSRNSRTLLTLRLFP